MTVVVVATLFPASGQREAAAAAIEASIADVHAEPGCELYALHEVAGSDHLVMVEKWSSREALDTHLGAAPLAAISERLRPLCERPAEVTVLSPRPAGTERGAV